MRLGRTRSEVGGPGCDESDRGHLIRNVQRTNERMFSVSLVSRYDDCRGGGMNEWMRMLCWQ